MTVLATSGQESLKNMRIELSGGSTYFNKVPMPFLTLGVLIDAKKTKWQNGIRF